MKGLHVLRTVAVFIITAIVLQVIYTGAEGLPLTSSDSITISFVGDCTLGTDMDFEYKYSFPYRIEKVDHDYSWFFGGVKPIFEQDDLTIANLETTLTLSEKCADKKFCFKGDPTYANILTQGSVEMANISNNHIYDYFEQGFADTLSALDAEGISYCGEKRIAFYYAKDETIACLGYKGWSEKIIDEIAADIDAVDDLSDIITVSFHWGSEYSFYPDETQKKLAHFCIDKGADVVVGHHPHVIQGIEKYKNGLIAYSLGNFCFGGNRNPKEKDTFIFQAVFGLQDGGVSEPEPVIIPCSLSSVNWINDYQPIVLQGKEAERVINRLLKLSNPLKYGIKKGDLAEREDSPAYDYEYGYGYKSGRFGYEYGFTAPSPYIAHSLPSRRFSAIRCRAEAF